MAHAYAETRGKTTYYFCETLDQKTRRPIVEGDKDPKRVAQKMNFKKIEFLINAVPPYIDHPPGRNRVTTRALTYEEFKPILEAHEKQKWNRTQ